MKTIYYKALNRDLTYRDLQYEEGKTYVHEGEIELGWAGFSFCKDLPLTLRKNSTDVARNRYAEVEVLGKVLFEQPTARQGVTDKIKILRILSDDEVLSILGSEGNSGQDNSGYGNSGDRNSGHGNSGYGNSWNENSGDRNSGHGNLGNFNSGYKNYGNDNSGNENSGDFNTGDHNMGEGNSGDANSGAGNSGNENSGDFNSGNFNSGQDNSGHSNSGARNSGAGNSGNENSGDLNAGDLNAGDFNTGNYNSGDRNSGRGNSGDLNSGDLNSGDWNSCDCSSGFFNISSTLTAFGKPISYEKWSNTYKPKFLFFTPNLPRLTYKESFLTSWEEADRSDRIKVLELPNFDADIFFEISGIDLR